MSEDGLIEMCTWGAGEGLPILMLHEGLGSAAMWRGFPEALAQACGRRVIAFSRQGYGQSGAFAAPYGTDFMHREADAAEALMTQLGLEQAHLYGHSDGASIALLLAARHPARAASLVLEAPHVFVEPMCLAQITAFGRQIGETDTIHRLGRYHRDAAAVFRQWHDIWTDPAFPCWSIEADIAGLALPALLIQGEDDAYGTMAQLDRVAGLLTDTRQLRLPYCGHSPHREAEEAVLAAVRTFLREMP